MNVFVKKQDNLKLALASAEGKTLLYVDEKEHVELPPILAEALLFHINRATENFKCEFDNREPQDTLVTQEESEKVFQQQEAAIETLKGERDSFELTATELAGKLTETETVLEKANEEIASLRLQLQSKKASETPILEATPEPS